jgi:type IV pilus assembly protein PilY1
MLRNRWSGGLRAAGYSALSLLMGLLGLGFQTALAVETPYSTAQMAAYPPNLKAVGGAPMMMLVASRDHTLFAPIFTDFEDLDGDGVMDTTYKPSFRYYGYFEQDKCYVFNSATTRFEPSAAASANATTKALICDPGHGYWLGNFLNWATMTRIDVIRKMLYGGYRVEDTDGDTTLQMAPVSQDAHSFVKYYGGADVGRYTPFSDADLGGQGLTICNRGSSNAEVDAAASVPKLRLAKGNFSLWATIPSSAVCRWTFEGGGYAFGAKTRAFFTKYGNFGAATDAAGQLLQAHKTTVPSAADRLTAPGADAGSELAVRVQACAKVGSLSLDSHCRIYPGASGTPVYKPVGLLQDYGTSASPELASRVEFGLMTGSYDWNLRGGALRKNMGSLNDEVDLSSGRFCHHFDKVTPPTTCNKAGGVVKTFDNIRLYQIGYYNKSAFDLGILPAGAPFVLPDQLSNGAYSSWGNPMSEMVVQSLYYLANKSMQNAPIQGGGASRVVDQAVGLPAVDSVVDPFDDQATDGPSGLRRKALYGRSICRPVNVLAISSGSTNFDSDAADSATLGSLYDGLNTWTGTSAEVWTNQVGAREGINGTIRSIGDADAGFGLTPAPGNTWEMKSASCEAKALASFGRASGVCPDAPGIKGSYLGAGAAYFANTHFLRSDSELARAPATLPTYAGRAKTYAASLAGGTARIEVPVGQRTVVITPESAWDHNQAEIMPGAMLTFRAIGSEKVLAADGSVANQSGSYVVTWNDTQFGGDYDMDMVGFLRWEVAADPGHAGDYLLDVYTDVLAHDAGAKGVYGFSIAGTGDRDAQGSMDRRFLTHGSNDMARAVDSACNTATVATTSADYVLHCRFTNFGMMMVTDPIDFAGGMGRLDRYVWPTSATASFGGTVATKVVDFFDVASNDAAKATTTTRTRFHVSGATDTTTPTTLRDPLWYMAKYGSFDTGETTFARSTAVLPNEPTAQGAGADRNWDKLKNDGRACVGGACADGEPDGYFLARRPDLLEDRLRNLFEGLNLASNATVAVSSAQLVNGSLKYVASYQDAGIERSGTVKAFALKSDDTFATEPSWDGGGKLAKIAPEERQVITNGQSAGSGSSTAPGPQVGVALDYGVVNALHHETSVTTVTNADGSTSTASSRSTVSDYLRALGGGTDEASISLSQSLIGFLRGSASEESQLFISRGVDNRMGTVVNSSPWLQDPAAPARYSDGDFTAVSGSHTRPYSEFVMNRVANNKVLWVGSNDGLLHGFDALTGRPLLSYVPGSLASSLATALSATRKEAMPLMDGSPFTGDVLIGSGTANATWKTYLFGSTGRGGRAVFALDVTDTGTATGNGGLTQGQAANVFKWIFTAKDDADLGYSLSDPVYHASSDQATPVVYLNNHKFAVLQPNGYGSTSGKGALFILFADGPGSSGQWSRLTSANAEGNYVKLYADESETGTGFTGVTWADLDNNGTADVLYATDLKGRLWRFDVRSTNPAAWGVGIFTDGSSTPLFQAASSTGSALPITTPPVVTFPDYGGVMVSFGTGRAIDNGDFPNWSEHQRFFSVWDAGGYLGDQVSPPNLVTALDSTVTGGRALPSTDTMLHIRLARDGHGVVYRYTLAADGRTEQPVLTTDTADSFDPASQSGWYFEFPSTGEQLIFPPTALRTLISFTTTRPKNSTESESSCTANPVGTYYGINAFTGQAVKGLLSVASPGTDQSSVGYGQESEGLRVRAVVDKIGFKTKDNCPPNETCDRPCQCSAGQVPWRREINTVQSVTGASKASECTCIPASNLRLRWREIPGMRTK